MKAFDENDLKYFKIEQYGDFLIVNSSNIDEEIKLINKKKIKNICVNYVLGYDTPNLEFLKKCPDIEMIYIVGDNYQLESLNYLEKLRFISTSSSIEKIDFGNFQKLEYCCINWNKNPLNIEKCQSIIHLKVNKYKSNTNDLSEFPLLEKLQYLELVESPIISLKGIERFKNSLKELECYYLKKLEDIGAIVTLLELNSFVIANCKKIENYNIIERVKSLTKLKITNCNDIESLKFIRNMKNLKFFSFVNTNIKDGDMTPCLNLEYVGFLGKKHYSHSADNIRQMIAEKKRNLSSK
jgi:hypothetical protein